MRHLSDLKILDMLRCPICGAAMEVRVDSGASLVCSGARVHCYDFARGGYVNLSAPGKSAGGDSKEAVHSRSAFLDLGYYATVAEALAELCAQYVPSKGTVIDAGCGEGYYSAFLARKDFSVFGADLSKFAVDSASKRLSREQLDNSFFATSSVFELPINDKSADAVINVFAPCAESEFSRVLKTDGILLVAWAGERHLWGLKNAIYDTTRENTERADLPQSMIKVCDRRISYTIDIDGNDGIMNLFSMTPYYWRTSPSDGEKLKKLQKLSTEVDIIISVYQNTDIK